MAILRMQPLVHPSSSHRRDLPTEMPLEFHTTEPILFPLHGSEQNSTFGSNSATNGDTPDTSATEPTLWDTLVQAPFVDTPGRVTKMLDALVNLSTNKTLSIDLEGNNLGRNGTIAIFQMYVPEIKTAYLIDVHTLGRSTFSITASDGVTTFKHILENLQYIKLLYDLRQDSDALCALYGIRLRGVEDVQLMTFTLIDGSLLPAYWRAVERHARLSPDSLEEFKRTKQEERARFRDKDFTRFAVRPLDVNIQKYCINDVLYLEKLRDIYWPQLDITQRKRIIFETEFRVQQSQAEIFETSGARGPGNHWHNYGVPGYPFASTNLEPDTRHPYRPDCFCGRFKGMRHHCSHSCVCYEVCCAWWIERALPTDETDATPVWDALPLDETYAVPLEATKVVPRSPASLAYDIPSSLFHQILSISYTGNPKAKTTPEATAADRHIFRALDELRKKKLGVIGWDQADAIRLREQPPNLVMRCRNMTACNFNDGWHSWACIDKNCGRDGRHCDEEDSCWHERETWRDTAPRRNAWANADRVELLKTGLREDEGKGVMNWLVPQEEPFVEWEREPYVPSQDYSWDDVEIQVVPGQDAGEPVEFHGAGSFW